MFEADHRAWHVPEAMNTAPKGRDGGLAGLGPETRLATIDGPVALRDLRVGDRVLTRDAGYQPVLWRGPIQASGGAAIHLRAGALHNAGPLVVTPEQGILVAHPIAELMFGTAEVMVPAAFLVDGPGISRGKGAEGCLSLVLEGHQIVYAEGISVETLCLDARGLAALGAARDQMTAHLPWLAGPKPRFDLPARRVLDRLEARVLMSEVRAAGA